MMRYFWTILYTYTCLYVCVYVHIMKRTHLVDFYFLLILSFLKMLPFRSNWMNAVRSLVSKVGTRSIPFTNRDEPILSILRKIIILGFHFKNVRLIFLET